MKKFIFKISLFILVFGFTACNLASEKTEENLPIPVKTAENLPSDLLFYELREDDHINDLLISGGVKSTEEVATFINGFIQKEYPDVEVSISINDFACSAFIAPAENNAYYVGRNFDWNEVSEAIIVRNIPSNGDYASVSTFNTDFINIKFPENLTKEEKLRIKAKVATLVPLDGFNEKGLVIAVLNQEYDYAYNLVYEDTGKTDLTTTTAVRMLLNKAANVEEAVDLIKKYDFHSDIYTAHHLFIADATGKSVVVEWDYDNKGKNKGLCITDSNCVTNHPLYLYDDSYSDEKLIYEYGDSVFRYIKLKYYIENNATFSLADAKDLLKKVQQNITVWSIVYYISPDYCEENFFWRSRKNNWNDPAYVFSSGTSY